LWYDPHSTVSRVIVEGRIRKQAEADDAGRLAVAEPTGTVVPRAPIFTPG
jgi:hypothetical protein